MAKTPAGVPAANQPGGISTLDNQGPAAAGQGHVAAADEKSVTEKAKGKAQETARAAKRTAQDAVDRVATEAEKVADDAIATGRAEADRFVSSGKSQAENVIRSVGRAIEASSQSLEDDGMRATAGYVRAAATGLHRAADEIDEFDTGGVTGRLEGFVRSQPMLTVGVLALAGFVLAGSLNKSKRR